MSRDEIVSRGSWGSSTDTLKGLPLQSPQLRSHRTDSSWPQAGKGSQKMDIILGTERGRKMQPC